MSNAAKEIYTKAVEEQGVVLVAASGNDNDDTRYFPASHPSVISVGALGSSGTRYFSSNFNDQVEFVAPGQDIVSTTVSTNALQTANFAYPANTVLGTARTSVAGNLVACDMSRVVDKGICEEVQEQANGICMFAMNSAVDDKKTFDVPVEDLVEVCVTSGGIGAVVYDESLGGRPIPNLYAFGTSPIPAIAVSKTSAYQILETMELEGTSDNFQVGIGDAENDRIEYTFAVLSGTSMAAPHVTAAFALLKSHYPQCSQWQIRLALAETATNPDGNGVCNDEYGYGLVQVKDAFDWLESKGDCEDWIPEQVSAGGCQTQSFSAAASPSPTKSPTTKPTEALTEAPTPEPTPAITMQPTPVPTITLTPAPTRLPTTVSATLPSPVLTRLPTAAPVLFGPGPPSSNQTSSSNSIVSHWYND
jgi:serine protease